MSPPPNSRERVAQTYGKLSQDPTKANGLRARNAPVKDDSDEEVDETNLTERERAKMKWVRRLNWVWRKLTAIFWVSITCLMIWYTNFFRVIWESPLVNRTYFYLGLACLFFNIAMLIYMAIWLAWINKVHEPWETHCPKAIPVMAVVGLSTAAFFFFAFWRVWGLLTLVIQFVFFLGFINAGQLLPGGPLGSILMFVIFFGAFFTSEMIPHHGMAHYTPPPTQLGTL